MTLTEYCTGIADAIREKEGSTEAIPAADHAARIRAISGGGFETVQGSISDYTGTLHYTNGQGEVEELAVDGWAYFYPAKNTIFTFYPDVPYATISSSLDVFPIYNNRSYYAINDFYIYSD